MSVRAAGIPKPVPIPLSPYVPELISPSNALPLMRIAFWCVWAAYTTTELPEVARSTVMSPEVAADAAEPQGVVALNAASSEVAAHAAEPFEAVRLVSAPSMVVAPNNVLPACHVTVKRLSMNSSCLQVLPL